MLFVILLLLLFESFANIIQYSNCHTRKYIYNGQQFNNFYIFIANLCIEQFIRINIIIIINVYFYKIKLNLFFNINFNILIFNVTFLKYFTLKIIVKYYFKIINL